jgi:uncharacterized protein
MTLALPVISCDTCNGACCRHMVMPPFVPYFYDGSPLANEEFTTFRYRWPELYAELLAEYDRKQREHDWPEESPCFWLDQATGKCKHYDARPDICREFEVGSPACVSHREGSGP